MRELASALERGERAAKAAARRAKADADAARAAADEAESVAREGVRFGGFASAATQAAMLAGDRPEELARLARLERQAHHCLVQLDRCARGRSRRQPPPPPRAPRARARPSRTPLRNDRSRPPVPSQPSGT